MSRSTLNLVMAFVLVAGLAFLFFFNLRDEPYGHVTVDDRECITHGEGISCDWNEP